MSLQDEYNFCQSGQWAELNPSKCPCRSGWMLSDLDTWHRCPMHGAGVPHPEEFNRDDSTGLHDPPDFDFAEHKLQNFRNALLGFQAMASDFGLTPPVFKSKVMDLLVSFEQPTPAQWVDAAEAVYMTAQMGDERLRYAGLHPDQLPPHEDADGIEQEQPEPDAERIALDKAYERDTYFGQFDSDCGDW
jgi:hypothetical protein